MSVSVGLKYGGLINGVQGVKVLSQGVSTYRMAAINITGRLLFGGGNEGGVRWYQHRQSILPFIYLYYTSFSRLGQCERGHVNEERVLIVG